MKDTKETNLEKVKDTKEVINMKEAIEKEVKEQKERGLNLQENIILSHQSEITTEGNILLIEEINVFIIPVHILMIWSKNLTLVILQAQDDKIIIIRVHEETIQNLLLVQDQQIQAVAEETKLEKILLISDPWKILLIQSYQPETLTDILVKK